MWDMTHSYVRHGDMTHPVMSCHMEYVRHDSFICVTWFMPCDMTHNSALKNIPHCTHMNESCHTYEWVMSHRWMSHVTRMNESCLKYEWVMSQIWMNHVTHLDDFCHCMRNSAECLLRKNKSCPVWMSHVTHMKRHVNVAVCCSVVQCGAEWCSILQCLAAWCSMSH